ncbi:MAG: VWA domain-containing protein [Kiritimatiellaeota bacterium]|nr:VWA domain-containing protein [Kiritimatiellota bacterium]
MLSSGIFFIPKFAQPWMLLLYLPYAILLALALKRRKPSLIIPSVRVFKSANPRGGFHPIASLPFLLHAIGLALLIFSVARPQKGIEMLKQRAEGIDIMLALDLSGSMEAIDVPESYKSPQEIYDGINKGVLNPRINIAKKEIRKFIERRPNDRIGLIAFAPLPYVACPPTLDHAWLYAHLDQLEPNIIGNATGIAGPIASAVHRLKDSDSKRKVLVLFTDGSNNVKARVTPRQAAKLAKTFNVIIYTVGIGSPNAFIIQDHSLFGRSLRQMGGEFDETLLKDIAELSGGKYYTASDAKGLEKVMREIDKLEKTTKEQPRYVDYRELGPQFVFLGLILILAAFLLQSTVAIKIP